MPLVQLIYVSSACRELSDEELEHILESSIRHNTQQGITGVLLYTNGRFMQVIEGEEAAIETRVSREACGVALLAGEAGDDLVLGR